MMSPQQQSRPRPRFRMAEVRRVQKLTPHMVRVTLAGEDLADFQQPVPTQHVKLIFPKPGEEKPALPDFGSGGPPPPGQERPLMRTYTPRRYDAANREMDVDFVLHGEGPAASWATAAKPGDWLAMAGPGGRYSPDASAEWYVIAGDESAIPAIGTLLDTLESHQRADIYVEVAGSEDELPLNSKAKLNVSWLHRDGRRQPGEMLEAALRRVELPTGRGRVWVACESSVVRRLRRYLLDERKLGSDSVITRGYWKQGESNHPDHDYGEDGER